ncbi:MULTISPECIES: septal ring lytic transglycosylase RlpA family protein [unclassified Luteimonas]
MRRLLPLLAIALLAGCAGTQNKPSSAAGAVLPPRVADSGPPPDCTGFKPYPAAQEDPGTRGNYVAGGLYRPGVSDTTPDYLPNVDCIPEPAVIAESRSNYGNRSPYSVLGKSYRVLDSTDGFVESGVASYYGNKFHGRRTSNQEVYDMYAFTAAHKSLPLPSFARVTNLDNGRSVVVRVNDRGPFHEGRVVDLSYAAAVKLDIHRRGTGRVEVRALRPGEAGTEPRTLVAAASAPAPARVVATAGATGLDRLVGDLPQAPAATVVAVATPAPARTAPAPATAVARLADHPAYGRAEDRFRLVADDGRVRSADEFDTWMRERQARIDAAPGKATMAATAQSAAPRAAPPPAVPATSTPVAAAHAAPSQPPVAGSPGDVTLQVGVFSVRDNAERALAALHGAGIGGAHLQDVTVSQRRLWRLRVGPVAATALAELSSRVSGLGLGIPQIVRE